MREQVWGLLCNTKFKGFVLSILVIRFQKWDRNINIFLAVASSGSIAAWVVWNRFPFVWGAIIASSQVITVIKPYFPYFKLVNELNIKCNKVDLIDIDLERLWFKIQTNRISEDEYAEQYYEYRKQIVDIFNFADDSIFDVGTEMENRANLKMQTFLKTNYSINITV